MRESAQRCEALQEARDEALLKLEETSGVCKIRSVSSCQQYQIFRDVMSNYLIHVLLCTEGEQAALREKRRLDVEIEKLQVYVRLVGSSHYSLLVLGQ